MVWLGGRARAHAVIDDVPLRLPARAHSNISKRLLRICLLTKEFHTLFNLSVM